MIFKAKKILKSTFGYDDFRLLQEEVITSILSKNDSLVIMPTGGGKSLCYQIPALIFDGLTIVLSPLISLMKDQIAQLHQLGVEAAVLNSSLSPQEYYQNVELVESGKARLLYVAPETLLLDRTLALLKPLKIDCITIDEAHCISEWGHDFRPEYRKLVELREIFPEAVFVALTATATPRVQTDIEKSLMFKGAKKFVASFNRENLYLEITPKYDALNQTIKFLRKYPNQSGIIYCFSRKQVNTLAAELDNAGFSVRPYHAGLTDNERKTNQELFIKDDVQIIVATIAFGMGINKSNVRFVIHYDLPKNIESYYQEIGRSGRDGLRAHCLLLFSHSDTMKIKYFIDQKEAIERRIALNHLNALLNYAETGVCRREPLLTYFGEEYNKPNCGMCDNCNSEAKTLVDITIPTQKFLSCIKRANEGFGAAHIIDILRGSKAQKILDWSHQNLSTYGIGLEHTKKQWMFISHQLIRQNLIAPDPEHGALKITSKGYEVLTGSLAVNGTIKEDFEPKHEVITDSEFSSELFNALREKRKQIAGEMRLPPYVIFSDKTLTEMAALYPTSKKEMMGIYGMGEVKYERYGILFMDIVIRYCQKNKIKEIDSLPKEAFLKKAPKKSKVNETIAALFNTGNSVTDIMGETKLKKSTILGHLYTYSQNNKLKNVENILEDCNLSDEMIEKVTEVFTKLGCSTLSPVYAELREKVPYDELHLLRIYYLSKLEN
ncbi:MAG: DNA helicase RecQ [Bacteroidetes bacterium]|nr:DNA helicase RecQ [Bacteroidota bacterium]